MLTNYDELLNIQTKNQSIRSDESSHYFPYETTPYPPLHALFKTYQVEQTDRFVDFGCGKGRLLFYVHHHFDSSVIGIEMNEYLYEKTLKNKQRYVNHMQKNHNLIQIKCGLAESYEVKANDNIFYFFNPFSLKIFKIVIGNILQSIRQKPREVDVILYYPHTEYIDFLKTTTSFKLIKKVKVPRLYHINNREHFLIFRG